MTELSRKILADYQVRKKKAQKQAFIDLLQEHMELNVEKGGTSRNIVVGDVKNAKLILTAHYDTCAVLPIPNFIMPKNIVVSLLYSLLLCIPIIGISAGMSLLMAHITHNSIISLLSLYLSMIGMFVLLMAGPANKHTANDNTSGVITLIEIMSALTQEERAQVAFVFFDNEELGLLGSSHFRKMHKAELANKLLINFDCVSDGDTIMLILNRAAKTRYGALVASAFSGTDEKKVLLKSAATTFFPSDQAGFPVNIGVASFKKCFLGLYMDRIHTPRDTVFDEKNIALIKEGVSSFVKTL